MKRFLLTSIFGADAEEFAQVARMLAPLSDGLELNLSCPHAKGYGMAIGQDPDLVAEIVAAVVAVTDIPVIANGDIVDAATARSALAKSGADGVMIGRGAQGRPWVLAQVSNALHGTPKPDIPTGSGLADLVCGHYEDMLAFYGGKMGNRVARKHLGWYMDHAGTPPGLRRLILTSKQPNDVLRLLPDALWSQAKGAA
mgnify:CR=1 FL=1